MSDVRNRRIQKLDSQGRFKLEFGRGLLERPAGIGIGPDDALWVTDFDQDKIFRFNSEGKLLASWGKAGDRPGELDSPADIAVDSRGFIYVVDEYHHKVQKFSDDGTFILAWGKKGKVNVVRSALNFLMPGGHNGEFYYPSRIAIAPNDHVYISDAYNNRVQVFDSHGLFIQSIGGMGLWGGRFRISSGLAIDSGGSLFVADFYNNRIQHFDAKGNYLAAWGGEKGKSGYFNGPTGVAITSDGSILVADWGNHRVQQFLPD
ncbi:MAG: NHL repeat-containing protein [Mariprofundaceae bacterium]